jgi:hypothetical protein
VKIKLDYITNSSSTCFVVILKDEANFSEENFMHDVGIEKNSPVYHIFKELYSIIISNMRDFDLGVAKHRWRKGRKWDAFIEDIFSADLVERISEAKTCGDKVYFGTLSSDDSTIESFFCCDSFKIEGNTFYIDASNSSW